MDAADASSAAAGNEGDYDSSDEWRAIGAALVAGARYGVKIRLPHALVMTFMFRRDLSMHGKANVILRAVWEHAKRLGSFALVYKTVLVVLKYMRRRQRWQWQNTIEINDPYVPSSLRRGDNFSFITTSLGRMIANLLGGGGGGGTNTNNNDTASSSLPGRPEHKWDALIAGAVGGYLVWGKYSAVSHQVLYYISIRVLAAVLGKLCLSLHDFRQHDNDNNSSNSSNNRNDDLQYWQRVHRLASTVAWALVMYMWEASPDSLQQSMRKSMDEIYDSLPPLSFRSVANQSKTSKRPTATK